MQEDLSIAGNSRPYIKRILSLADLEVTCTSLSELSRYCSGIFFVLFSPAHVVQTSVFATVVVVVVVTADATGGHDP